MNRKTKAIRDVQIKIPDSELHLLGFVAAEPLAQRYGFTKATLLNARKRHKTPKVSHEERIQYLKRLINEEAEMFEILNLICTRQGKPSSETHEELRAQCAEIYQEIE